MNELFTAAEGVSPVNEFCKLHGILLSQNKEGEWAASKTILHRSDSKLQAVYALARDLNLQGTNDLVI